MISLHTVSASQNNTHSTAQSVSCGRHMDSRTLDVYWLRCMLCVVFRCTHLQLIASSSTEVNNHIQSLLLNYLAALFGSGGFTLVYYQMGELEYIRITECTLYAASAKK